MQPVMPYDGIDLVDDSESGLGRRVVFAKDQPGYEPLPALVFRNGKVLTEWSLTPEEREAIARGANLRLWIWKFNQPLQPVALQVATTYAVTRTDADVEDDLRAMREEAEP